VPPPGPRRFRPCKLRGSGSRHRYSGLRLSAVETAGNVADLGAKSFEQLARVNHAHGNPVFARVNLRVDLADAAVE
jgi:hypothetical protein